MQIQIKILMETNESLSKVKDDLADQKDLLEQRRDALRKDAAAYEEQAERRLQKKMQSNQNRDIKILLAETEQAEESGKKVAEDLEKE